MDLSELVKHLRQRRIPIHVSEEDGQQVLWVATQADIKPLLELLEQWRQGRLSLSASPERDSSQANLWFKKLKLIFSRFPITSLLLIGCTFGYIITSLPTLGWFRNWLAFDDFTLLDASVNFSGRVFHDQPWRLVTPMFLHFGFVHLAFNAVMLWFFGTRLEQVMGRWHFLVMILFSSAISNIGQYWWDQSPNFGGMSGVNYGLIGYVWIRHLFAPNSMLAMPKGLFPLFIGLLLLGIFGVIDHFIQGRVANGAHAVGFLVGISWGAAHGWHLSRRSVTN